MSNSLALLEYVLRENGRKVLQDGKYKDEDEDYRVTPCVYFGQSRARV